MNKEFIINTINDRTKPTAPLISHLSNICAICYNELDNINWLGIYLMSDDCKSLFLGPFQGREAISTIQIPNGVCGFAVHENRTIIVEDVHAFPTHIACDLRSKSEIVIPIYDKNKNIWGLIDVDSPLLSNFSNQHKELFEEISQIITNLLTDDNLLLSKRI